MKARNGKGIVYAIEIVGAPGIVKIGHTTAALQKRLWELQSAHHAQLQIVASAEVETHVEWVEKALHRLLQTTHERGEWFAMDINQDNFDALVRLAVQHAAQVSGRDALIPEQEGPGLHTVVRGRPVRIWRAQHAVRWHTDCKDQWQEVRMEYVNCACGVPQPHDHGPCRLCAFYTDRRPGDSHSIRRPTCLHHTMSEARDFPTGSRMVWGDLTVRNGEGLCPTFRRKEHD